MRERAITQDRPYGNGDECIYGNTVLNLDVLDFLIRDEYVRDGDGVLLWRTRIFPGCAIL